ncbi:MAG TPA: glycosyltransferase family 1 protein [Thermoanaerobaculia bacterium]|nr:glycosyltransferase family 1 protein [Thermoanaerobaculia bacterium]
MPSPPPANLLPTIAVDLRPLVRTVTGIGVYTRSLLLELAGRGDRSHRRYLGLAHGPVEGAEEFAAAGIPTEIQPAPLGVIWQQLRLPKRLAAGDIDLFWSPHMTLPLRCPVPAVATVHDLTTLLFPDHHRVKVRWSVYPFLHASLDRARRIVADSKATAADLRFHFPDCADRVEVIYPGVDAEFRPGSPEEIATTRAEIGAPDGYLLYAGTLEPRKNVGAILDAWEFLAEKGGLVGLSGGATPPLVLVGPYGWGGPRLLERIEALQSKGLIHLGPVPRARLVRLFQAASVFVYPSLYEGFGLPAAEALACGVPTVVSNRSSLPEVVGKAGLQVEIGEPAALAEALGRLLADPGLARELAARGPAQAARFTWSRAADRMDAIFTEAINS